ncbi:N-acetyltransferase family protein [Streptomyces sp. NBC_00470]|uniref:GNAT family N-acetyltransferase n=1 Tax=Streptomyces sp. NBC_00470 TaxID=2975753 RepID=UPI0032498782
MQELLESVEFSTSGVAAASSWEMTHRLTRSDYVSAWVAEGPRKQVCGVVMGAPPLPWLGTVPGLGRAHRDHVARCIVEAEAVAVAPGMRGRRLGHELLRRLRTDCQRQGFRVMLGTLLLKNCNLVGYYMEAGFTVLGPGETLSFSDPLGVVLRRPADPDVIQAWQPLHPDVRSTHIQVPEGQAVPVIDGALPAPDYAGQREFHQDGSMTMRAMGQTVTLPADLVEQIRLTRSLPVSLHEVQSAAGEAELYGMEPLVAAQIRKATGATLTDLFSSPPHAPA